MKENWTYKKLGEVASFSRGLTFAKSDVADVSSKKVLRSNNIDLVSHSLNFDDVACLKEGFIIPEEKKLHKGDIFICMSNGSTQHLGKVAFIDDDMDYAFGGFMGAIHPDVKLVYPKFAFYSCLSTEYRRFLASILNGVNINNLKWSELSKFTIPVPPIETQSRIVSELDLLQSIIDKQKAQLKELDNLAQAVFYDMFGDPVENEKGWEVKKFKDCFKLSSGKGLTAKAIVHGNYPVYGGNGIVGYHCDYNIDGDNIIIGRVGALCGNVRNVLGKAFITDNAFILTKHVNSMNVFVLYLLRLHNLRQYARDALQPVISNTGFKDIGIIVPPLPLQQSFASKIESIEKQKAAITQSIAETQRLFDYTMDKYFG
ncbi:MAG: restriction endonuclease subunit S [Bacteroidales bacterium]|nr:restriction endonuclease subunit S [Bacteroidales bacterium]